MSRTTKFSDPQHGAIDNAETNFMVSVVIPAYNASSTIEATIRSVRKQSIYYDKVTEIIIINDGSTDNTLDRINVIRKKLKDKKIKVFSTDNKGPSAARNLGILKSSNNWIAFLDADDCWSTSKLQTQISILEKLHDNRVAMVATATDKMTNQGGRRILKDVYEINAFQYLLKSRTATSSVLVNKEAITRAELFDENIKHAEDEKLFVTLLSKNTCIYINKSLVKLAQKRTFGEAGLSSNLHYMHVARISNIKLALHLGTIYPYQKLILIIAEYIKFARRLLITIISYFRHPNKDNYRNSNKS